MDAGHTMITKSHLEPWLRGAKISKLTFFWKYMILVNICSIFFVEVSLTFIK